MLSFGYEQLAHCWDQRQDFRRAISNYRRALQYLPREQQYREHVDAIFGLANDLARTGDITSARGVWRDAWLYFRSVGNVGATPHADEQILRQNFTSSFGEFLTMARRYPPWSVGFESDAANRESDRVFRALRAAQGGAMSEAQQMFQTTLRTVPGFQEVHFYLGCVYFAQHKSENAATEWEAALVHPRYRSADIAGPDPIQVDALSLLVQASPR